MKDKKIKIVIAGLLMVVIGVIVRLVYFRSEFLYAGTIEATEVDIPARVASVISTRDVEEGQHLKEGQVLMKFTARTTELPLISQTKTICTTKLYRQEPNPKRISTSSEIEKKMLT